MRETKINTASLHDEADRYISIGISLGCSLHTSASGVLLWVNNKIKEAEGKENTAINHTTNKDDSENMVSYSTEKIKLYLLKHAVYDVFADKCKKAAAETKDRKLLEEIRHVASEYIENVKEISRITKIETNKSEEFEINKNIIAACSEKIKNGLYQYAETALEVIAACDEALAALDETTAE